ncbi:MAG: hypothetical protein KGJ21_02345 [Pseudomonadota bacterium]|nr:hypothetical protein [Pseudomonadota bacterium]
MSRPPHSTSLADNGRPHLMPRDNALRRKIGRHVSLGQIFTLERMQECQQMLNTLQADFLKEMEDHLVIISDLYRQAENDSASATSMIHAATDVAFIIKTRMEALGFPFGFAVAKSLYEYMQAAPAYSSDALMVVCKHVAVLNIIIKEKITDGGGQIGEEMLDNLKKLVRKVGS